MGYLFQLVQTFAGPVRLHVLLICSTINRFNTILGCASVGPVLFQAVLGAGGGAQTKLNPLYVYIIKYPYSTISLQFNIFLQYHRASINAKPAREARN